MKTILITFLILFSFLIQAQDKKSLETSVHADWGLGWDIHQKLMGQIEAGVEASRVNLDGIFRIPFSSDPDATGIVGFSLGYAIADRLVPSVGYYWMPSRRDGYKGTSDVGYSIKLILPFEYNNSGMFVQFLQVGSRQQATIGIHAVL